MDKLSVLVADDDPKIRKLVSANLIQRNHLVHEVGDGQAVLEYLDHEMPDLIILDLIMPIMNGNDVCLWIRRRGIDIPIMILSAHDEEDIKVRALDAGADDYVTKPFKVEEFLARMRALMRRAGPIDPSAAEHKVTIEGITIDLKGRRAYVDGVDIHLTRTEIALLAVLAENPDAIITHTEMLAKVWGE
jgi:DNA-binding response OmpR family regulator